MRDFTEFGRDFSPGFGRFLSSSGSITVTRRQTQQLANSRATATRVMAAPAIAIPISVVTIWRRVGTYGDPQERLAAEAAAREDRVHLVVYR